MKARLSPVSDYTPSTNFSAAFLCTRPEAETAASKLQFLTALGAGVEANPKHPPEVLAQLTWALRLVYTHPAPRPLRHDFGAALEVEGEYAMKTSRV